MITSTLNSNKINILYIVIFFLLVSLVHSCYYTTQGYYLLHYTYSAKKISKILETSYKDKDTQQFLNRVIAIRNYAKKIGLNSSKKYTTYKELDRDFLVAVVQAAETLSVEPYKWRYPFIGRLPYKGFYNVAHAKEEAQKLEKSGYDVLVRKVSAFSTLNMLPDPIYSFMKNYDESQLVEILFHEQMHATIWIKKQDSFNEQLATFVGREAMLYFMREKYGENSLEYHNIHTVEQDSKIMHAYLLEIKNKLESLYKDTTLNNNEKLIKKQNILEERQVDFQKNYITMFSEPDNYKDIRLDTLNNAFFSLLSTYESSGNEFEEAFTRCDNNILVFIEEMKKILVNKEAQKQPKEFMKHIPVAR